MGAPGIFLYARLEMRSPVYSFLFARVDQDQCDLPNPPLEITIAFDSLKPRVLSNSESQAILLAQLLQLGQHTISDHRDTLGIEAVHHGWNDIKFMLNGVGYEVGVNKNRIRRREGRIILEKE